MVEEDRLDLQQLKSMAKNDLITFVRQQIAIPSADSGTGTADV
jgi:hypothetical protein